MPMYLHLLSFGYQIMYHIYTDTWSRKLEGSCQCGGVQFQLESNTPAPYQLCACSICRKVGGYGGSVNIGGITDTMQITQGRELIKYILIPKKLASHANRQGNTLQSKIGASQQRRLARVKGLFALTAVRCYGIGVIYGRNWSIPLQMWSTRNYHLLTKWSVSCRTPSLCMFVFQKARSKFTKRMDRTV